MRRRHVKGDWRECGDVNSECFSMCEVEPLNVEAPLAVEQSCSTICTAHFTCIKSCFLSRNFPTHLQLWRLSPTHSLLCLRVVTSAKSMTISCRCRVCSPLLDATSVCLRSAFTSEWPHPLSHWRSFLELLTKGFLGNSESLTNTYSACEPRRSRDTAGQIIKCTIPVLYGSAWRSERVHHACKSFSRLAIHGLTECILRCWLDSV